MDPHRNIPREIRKWLTRPQKPALKPGFRYHSVDDFVLQEGVLFSTDKKTFSGRRETARECFRNAALLAIRSGLTYCEGYGISVMPMLHAWCINENGIVIDPTWKEGTDYFGIPFKEDYLLKTIVNREKYGILWNPEMRFPLLQTTARNYRAKIPALAATTAKLSLTKQSATN